MKNDFDFIKDKVENSGVNAPAHMDENYVLDRISDTRPQVVSISAAPAQHTKKPKKRRTGRITAIAAAIVAVAVLGTALTVHFTRNKAVQPAVAAGEADQITGLIRFSSYDEVHDAVKALRSRAAYYTDTVEESDFIIADGVVPNGVDAYISKNANSGSKGIKYGGQESPDSHSETYKQVDGVDEGDRIKTDGRYIYVIDSRYGDSDYSYTPFVSVFPAKPGVTDPILRIRPGQNYVVELPVSTDDEATPDEPSERKSEGNPDENISICDLYLNGGRMVILCYTGGYGYGYGHAGAYYSGENKTRAYVYDIADMNRVRLLDTFSQSGHYTSSRMIGDTLYLVTNEYQVEEIPCCGRGDDPDEIEANCIYSIVEPTQSSFLIVSAYNTADRSAATDSKAVLGLGSDVYCSRDNLYISAADYSSYYRNMVIDYTPEYKDDDMVANDSDDEDSAITFGDDLLNTKTTADQEEDTEVFTPKTRIFKVSLHDGVCFTACGEVEGYTNNQYSFDEYNGYLRVATTSNNADYEDVNHLFVLDGELNVVGSVTGFAQTESIKAVRYVGNTAYVITYEQTDPLFVIDLSSPTAPAILGEVKISGFSTMLVPVDENTILGLGVNTGEYDYTTMEVQDGFKLALFDVSDKSNPKVLDSKSFVNYSSEVMYNPKALVYNPDRGDYIIPLDYYRFDASTADYDALADDEDWKNFYEAHTEQYGAVLNFRVEGGSIVVDDLHITSHDSISRCIYVGDTVYAIWFGDNGEAHLDSFSYR